jgi:hypothetical protein
MNARNYHCMGHLGFIHAQTVGFGKTQGDGKCTLQDGAQRLRLAIVQ